MHMLMAAMLPLSMVSGMFLSWIQSRNLAPKILSRIDKPFSWWPGFLLSCGEEDLPSGA
jgi:hypothetical protein